MCRNLFRWLLGLFTLCLALGGGGGGVAGSPEPPADVRRAIAVPLETRQVILADMRGMLNALNQTLEAISAGEPERAREAARQAASGVSWEQWENIRPQLPADYLGLHRELRRQWGVVAENVASENASLVLFDVAELSGQCVDCHTLYRLERGGQAH